MKTIKLYVVEDRVIDRDSFSEYFYNYDEAKKQAEFGVSYLTKREKQQREVYLIGYEVQVEDNDLSADELMNALWDDEIESPDFDKACGFFVDKAQICYEKIL